jgi:hypothetical protein
MPTSNALGQLATFELVKVIQNTKVESQAFTLCIE